MSLIAPALAQAVPPPDPSLDIEDYVLFAYEHLTLKDGTITGGNVGVNQNDPNQNNEELHLDNGFQMPQDTTQVVADYATIEPSVAVQLEDQEEPAQARREQDRRDGAVQGRQARDRATHGPALWQQRRLA